MRARTATHVRAGASIMHSVKRATDSFAKSPLPPPPLSLSLSPLFAIPLIIYRKSAETLFATSDYAYVESSRRARIVHIAKLASVKLYLSNGRFFFFFGDLLWKVGRVLLREI